MRLYLLVLLLVLAPLAWGQQTTAPTGQAGLFNSFTVTDKPNDDGSALQLQWTFYDTGTLKIDRSTDGQTWQPVTSSQKFTDTFIDSGLNPNTTYQYRFTINSDSLLVTTGQVSAITKASWFNTQKLPLLILGLLVAAAILYYIFSAKRGKDLFIRPIAGLDSMDEAVGRATEMGRPILFVPGINDLDDMQTLSGLTILGKLAYKAAEHDARILVPVARSMVFSAAREVVKDAYTEAGRPDAYNPDSVFYLTDDQFGFVAGVDGIILREKPAANFLLGGFYAESLILAETGFTSGAVQTAGTAMPSQLPFFVAACDYVLIGEELYAASAYLSRKPQELGSLKGQDIGKAIFIIVLVVGVILEIAGISGLKDFLQAG